eukprot:gene1944-18020_t
MAAAPAADGVDVFLASVGAGAHLRALAAAGGWR